MAKDRILEKRPSAFLLMPFVFLVRVHFLELLPPVPALVSRLSFDVVGDVVPTDDLRRSILNQFPDEFTQQLVVLLLPLSKVGFLPPCLLLLGLAQFLASLQNLQRVPYYPAAGSLACEVLKIGLTEHGRLFTRSQCFKLITNSAQDFSSDQMVFALCEVVPVLRETDLCKDRLLFGTRALLLLTGLLGVGLLLVWL